MPVAASSIAGELLQLAFESTHWEPYFNFDALEVPENVWRRDGFLLWLDQHHPLKVGLLRMHPYSCYDWHQDERRGCAVNMLLTGFETSHCVFAPRRDAVVFSTVELRYSPNVYYLFDTQVAHTVHNFAGFRYLMSVEFAQDKHQLPYSRLVATFKPQ